MDWEAIGAIGELTGAVGVVASLLYLAIQIRRDQQATTANTTQMRAAGAREVFLAIASSDHLAAILQKTTGQPLPGVAALQEQHGLSGEEAIRAHWLFSATLRQAEANLRMPMTEFERTQNLSMLAVGMSTAMGTWWAHAKLMFAPDFVQEIDRVRDETMAR